MKLIALFILPTPNLEESNSGSGFVEITTAIESNPNSEDRKIVVLNREDFPPIFRPGYIFVLAESLCH